MKPATVANNDMKLTAPAELNPTALFGVSVEADAAVGGENDVANPLPETGGAAPPAPASVGAAVDAGAAPELAVSVELPPAAEAAAVPFIALCWKAANVLSAVGFTANTIPFSQ